MNDRELLQAYAERGSEDAFRELVQRHLALVLAAARRQLDDPHLAEDVAQAVFTLLARKAASLGRDTVLPGWLWQTTRFVAARARRAEQRRQRRDQEAFAMQPSPSTTPVGSGAESDPSPWLDEALAQLKETDRHAVLLRFAQDRPLREVGLQLGITEDAAKKRVSRAIEKIRTFLGRHGVTLTAAGVVTALGSLRTEAGVTVPAVAEQVARGALHGGAGAGLAGGLAGALVQETLSAWRWARVRIAAAFAGAAVAIGLAVTHWPASPAPSAGMAGGNPSVAGTGPRAVSESANAAPASVPASKSPWPAGGGSFRLSVVDRDTGLPAANARLVAQAVMHGEWVPRFDLRTGEDGVADVPLPPGLTRLDIGVFSDGWAARYATFRPHMGDLVPATYTLRVQRVTNTLGGRIESADGRPVANASILFQFDGGGDSSGRETPRERSGTAVWNSPATVSGPDGRWSCAVVQPTGAGYSILVQHPDFRRTSLATPYSGDWLEQARAGRLVTRLQNGLVLRGRVLDAQGSPVRGALVAHDPYSVEALTQLTDAEGRFEFRQLDAGEFRMSVTAEGFSPQVLSPRPSGGASELEIRLQPPGLLRLRAVDLEGVEIPGVTFIVEEWDGHRQEFKWQMDAGTDGRVEWQSAPATGDLELCAMKDGWCATRDLHFRAGTEEHTVVMRRMHRMDVSAVDASTGELVKTFKAFPGYGSGSGSEAWERLDTRRSNDGRVRVEFSEGKVPWRIRVEAEGYEPFVSGSLEQSLPDSLVVKLERRDPAQAIRGVALRPDGSPAVGVQVALLTLEHNVILGRGRFERVDDDPLVLRTDAAGRFSFAADSMAHTVVAVGPEGFARLRVRDASQPVVLRMAPWGRIEGTIDPSCHLKPGETLRLSDPAAMNYAGRLVFDNALETGIPDKDGRFAMEFIPPGAYWLSINQGVGLQNRDLNPVDVLAGEPTPVTLKPRGPNLRGRFTGGAAGWDPVKEIAFAYITPREQRVVGDAASRDRHGMAAVDFWQSAVALEWLRREVNVRVTVRPDGTFESQDGLPPGDYLFRFSYKETLTARPFSVSSPSDVAQLVDLGEVELGKR